MVLYKVNDRIEAYVKLDGRVFSFESFVVHLDGEQVVVIWDRGYEVTPKMVYDGWPTYLEGLKVFALNADSEYYQNGYGWGKVIRKVEDRKKTKQIHRHEPGGMVCLNCTKMVQYASSNMSDGSFCCRNCRLYKGYMLPKNIHYIGYQGERE